MQVGQMWSYRVNVSMWMGNREAVYWKFEPAELISPTGGFFILSKVAAFGQQGFMRCSAWAGATETRIHT